MNVIIRTDAAEHIGIGHVIRCIALAQVLAQKGITSYFYSIAYNKEFLRRIEEEGFALGYINSEVIRGSTKDANQTIDLAKKQGASWVILDGYLFGAEYQRLLKHADLKILCIDDMASCHYVSDMVLNQNFGVGREAYSAEDYTRFFLGPEHALVRRDFLDAAKSFRRVIAPQVRHVLVTLGGGDPNNVTLKVLQALDLLGNTKLQVKVILGYLNKNEIFIRDFMDKASFQVKILKNVRHGMPELMQWADVAITAGGSTVWEYAHLATPVAGIILADNQRRAIEELNKIGAIFSLGWFDQGSVGDWAAAFGRVFNDIHLRESLSKSLHECVRHRKINEMVDVLTGEGS